MQVLRAENRVLQVKLKYYQEHSAIKKSTSTSLVVNGLRYANTFEDRDFNNAQKEVTPLDQTLFAPDANLNDPQLWQTLIDHLKDKHTEIVKMYKKVKKRREINQVCTT
jgi:hypothetical protein